jgi:hypothetical protein
MHFETGPGEQSQVGAAVLRLPDERLAQLPGGARAAFEHFGGLTREHLYDRPRTVWYSDTEGRRV